MKTRQLTLKVTPSVKVSAECILPENVICIMTLAHGAGAGMNHAFMVNLAHALGEAGIATLRFNFPFAEQGKGRPDTPAVAHQTIEAALDKAQELLPSTPLLGSGKSFGGRMTSQYISALTTTNVKGIVFYGFPLHPAGKPSTDRAEHLKNIKVPMLFLQGTKDTLADRDLIESVCSSLKKAKLVKLEGADHSFKAGKQDTMSMLVKATKEWVQKVVK